jgi:hypothetical protein
MSRDRAQCQRRAESTGAHQSLAVVEDPNGQIRSASTSQRIARSSAMPKAG